MFYYPVTFVFLLCIRRNAISREKPLTMYRP